MDTRRLQTFVRIVDIGSLTRAAEALHVAQPALSQQVNALEAELGQRLLIRSKQGVTPTEAGAALYRHAQVICKQVEDAVADVKLSGRELGGQVSVGLAPFSVAGLVVLPLLAAVRERYPRVLLRVSDNFGAVLSEAMTSGRLDLAVLYDTGAIPGIRLERLLSDELVLVRRGSPGAMRPIGLDALARVPLMLPAPVHTIHRSVMAACREAGVQPTVVAELESVGLMGRAVRAGLGATVLPQAVARGLAESGGLTWQPIYPRISVHLSLGMPSNLPLSRAAEAVRDELLRATASVLAGRPAIAEAQRPKV